MSSSRRLATLVLSLLWIGALLALVFATVPSSTPGEDVRTSLSERRGDPEASTPPATSRPDRGMLADAVGLLEEEDERDGSDDGDGSEDGSGGDGKREKDRGRRHYDYEDDREDD